MKEKVNFGLRLGYEAPRALSVEIESDGLILSPSLTGLSNDNEEFTVDGEGVWNNP